MPEEHHARRLSALARFLAPNEREYFDLFEKAGENIVRAADLLVQMLAEHPDSSEIARAIRTVEQENDQVTHEVIRRLNTTFVTPIDREDIYQLTSALDDVVDLTEEVADYLGLYRIEAPMDQAQRLAVVLAAAARQVQAAIVAMRGYRDINEHIVEAHRLENEGDRLVREAVAALFEVGTDPLVVIRWKDIFERLEGAIDATERAANIIEGIVIKNA
jgi:hypothetical protein